jgi:hypothetical protein
VIFLRRETAGKDSLGGKNEEEALGGSSGIVHSGGFIRLWRKEREDREEQRGSKKY